MLTLSKIYTLPLLAPPMLPQNIASVPAPEKEFIITSETSRFNKNKKRWHFMTMALTNLCLTNKLFV